MKHSHPLFRGKALTPLKQHAHIFRFLIAGALNTLIHFLIFGALIAQDITVVAANICAFLTANICSFFISSFFVFKVRVTGLIYYLKFLLGSLVGVFISWSVAKLCTNLSLHPYYTVIGTALLIPPVSYTLQKVVFNFSPSNKPIPTAKPNSRHQ
ncbi:GtrA family protein [Oleidesulfovibrio sp.]|uniref:GtrA family protein n=1 Tax=Oleidesulfovibrio sp. TaxID=2909707 RepID=UPI003A8A891C